MFLQMRSMSLIHCSAILDSWLQRNAIFFYYENMFLTHSYMNVAQSGHAHTCTIPVSEAFYQI
jgi:hypothetical protein